MKTITINVSEPVYAEFQNFAQKTDRPASELIREAMAEYQRVRMRPAASILTIPPQRLGQAKQPLDLSDLGDEMIP